LAGEFNNGIAVVELKGRYAHIDRWGNF